MIVIIDNYDSFTYNLYQYIGQMQPQIRVFRNDQVTIEELQQLDIDRIVISPGPGNPDGAGISLQVIREFCQRLPILGVCLGHQSIAQAFGGHIGHAKKIVHGKTSLISHTGAGVLAKLPNPFRATRYHSLIVESQAIPAELEVTATSEDGEIMALQHKTLPVYGVQFHPESIYTDVGMDLLQNFLQS